MRLQRETGGQTIILGEALGRGGEGSVYEIVAQPAWVAKLYHQPQSAQFDKIRAMLANPPEEQPEVKPSSTDSHPLHSQPVHRSIAWPIDLLLHQQQPIGFLMPRVSAVQPVLNFYNPRERRKHCPLFNYAYLHRTARNLALAFKALHSKGYVVGDVNESNILVKETALITLVDTDSFQVRAGTTLYRCPVGKPEFTPPELQGKNFREVDRQPEHDLFGLAIVLFQLLLEGTHPFTGVYTGQGEPPDIADRIHRGHFPYGDRGDKRIQVPYHPVPLAPPFSILAPSLQDLFCRCFVSGHIQPDLRPTATEWAHILGNAEAQLQTCSVNSQHRFGQHLPQCPWCKRTVQLKGRDPFPSQEKVHQGEHLVLEDKQFTSPRILIPNAQRGHIQPIPAPKPIPPQGLYPLPSSRRTVTPPPTQPPWLKRASLAIAAVMFLIWMSVLFRTCGQILQFEPWRPEPEPSPPRSRQL